MTVRGLSTAVGGQFQFDLVPLGTFTTAGVSSTQCDAGGYASLTAVVTHVTGTGTQFRVWLQGSYDGGTSWFGVPMMNVARTDVAALGLNETNTVITSTFVHSIINQANPFTATTVFVSALNSPPPLVRAAWNINGTTPSQTFSITCLLSMMSAS